MDLENCSYIKDTLSPDGERSLFGIAQEDSEESVRRD